MNNDHNEKSVFDLSPKEEAARLGAVTASVKSELFAKGLPFAYQDDRCPTRSHFIQEYPDGQVALALFHVGSRTYEIVKYFPNA